MTKHSPYADPYGLLAEAAGWDNRLCGRLTKTGKRCRAHSAIERVGNSPRHIGCYLHDPRRETHRQRADRQRDELEEWARRRAASLGPKVRNDTP
jgi:hypothetical protein